MTRGSVPIVKMSGAGNDFLVLGPEAVAAVAGDFVDWIRRVCKRGLSVGADGVLVVERTGADRARVRFYNPDGSEAFCGNGNRCAARFASLCGMTGNRLVLETVAGDVPAEVEGGQVLLRLPPPYDVGALTVDVGDEVLDGHHIVAGAPHFVTFVDDPAAAPLARWGPVVREHARFAPTGINLDLVAWDGSRVVLRTWEKGVERETLACGSGALAAAFVVRARGAGDRIEVLPRSGIPLEVRFTGTGEVGLRGDARIVLEGHVAPEAVHGFASD